MNPDNRMTVSSFNRLLNSYFGTIGEFIVEGEITQLNISTKGGVNIVIKDLKEQSVLNISGYQPKIQGINLIREGMQVTVWGVPQIWSPTGRFSLNVYKILPLGEGALKEAYENLKKKLSEEGLFNEDRKRSLPDFITKVALITAKGSAAYSDFVKILEEHHAGIEIDFYPVQVQGKHSQKEILTTLDFLKSKKEYDCIVLTRGGGSLEDLVTFNDEIIARSLFSAEIPTVVGVGHENDESIVDFVADIRASTPSQAAYYLVTQNSNFLKGLVMEVDSIRQSLIFNLNSKNMALTNYKLQIFNYFRSSLNKISSKTDLLQNNLNMFPVKLNNLQEKLSLLEKIISLNNPKSIMKKGYSIIRKSDTNKLILSTKTLKVTDLIDIQLYDGSLKTKVTKIFTDNS